MKDIFLGHLAATLNKPAEEIAELLYKSGDDGVLTDEMVENAAELLKAWDVERVKSLRASADNKKALDDQRKRGLKEGLEELEGALRKKYQIESDKIGVDLVDEIVAAVAKSDLPDDKVKRHPLYLSLEKRMGDEIKALSEQHEAERGKIEGEYAKRFILSGVKQRALTELETMGPVLPETPSIAANYKTLFAKAFEDYDYEAREDGEPLVLKGDKRLEDAHGNPITLDRLIKTTAAQFFTFKEQSAKGSAANKNGSTAGGQSGSVDAPKDDSDAWQKYQSADTPEAKKAIIEAYKKERGEIPV